MELSGLFLRRNNNYVSCQVAENIFTGKVTSLEHHKLENVGVDSFSSWGPQSSAELQDYLVTSSACVQLSTEKIVLHFMEAQEEMCALSPSLSSDRCSNNKIGRASNPLVTNATISCCQLISACPSGCIKQGMAWDHEWRRCQGMNYKAAKEPLPPFPAQWTCGGKAPRIPPQHSSVALSPGHQSHPQLWIILYASIQVNWSPGFNPQFSCAEL